MCFTMNSKTENIHLVSYSKYLLRFMYKWMKEQKGNCVLFRYNKVKFIQISKKKSVSLYLVWTSALLNSCLFTILTSYKKNRYKHSQS